MIDKLQSVQGTIHKVNNCHCIAKSVIEIIVVILLSVCCVYRRHRHHHCPGLVIKHRDNISSLWVQWTLHSIWTRHDMRFDSLALKDSAASQKKTQSSTNWFNLVQRCMFTACVALWNKFCRNHYWQTVCKC